MRNLCFWRVYRVYMCTLLVFLELDAVHRHKFLGCIELMGLTGVHLSST